MEPMGLIQRQRDLQTLREHRAVLRAYEEDYSLSTDEIALYVTLGKVDADDEVRHWIALSRECNKLIRRLTRG